MKPAIHRETTDEGTRSGPAESRDRKSSTAVIIPFFNDMAKLSRAVDSLLAQTLPPTTLVLVDDCGSERLDEGLRMRVEDAGVRLLLVRNEKNLGPGGSRQAGMDALDDDIEYLMFLDSDDFLSTNAIEALVDAHAKTPGLVATYASSLNIHTGEKRQDETREPYDNLLDGMLLGPRGWGTGSLLWRFRDIRSIRWPGMRMIEDSHFELSAALVNPRIRLVPEATIHIDQTWEPERLRRRNRHQPESDKPWLLELYRRILRHYPFETEEARRKRYLRRAAYQWSRRTPSRGVTYLREAFSFLSIGRWQVTLQILYYFPKYGMGRKGKG